MKIIADLAYARKLISSGKIVAYPTEAVYGLGCDPFNEEAVCHLLTLKKRSKDKGLIILIADWRQLYPLIMPISDHFMQPVRASWPGAVTWVFPKAAAVPGWVSGMQNSIAIRMSAHPIAHELSSTAPIVSTSANISGEPPALTITDLKAKFPKGIAAVVKGELGGASQPSAIYDVLSGARLR